MIAAELKTEFNQIYQILKLHSTIGIQNSIKHVCMYVMGNVSKCEDEQKNQKVRSTKMQDQLSSLA